MNRLEANISLILITFYAAVQYPFLTGVPESVSQFAFLCLTNLVGFVIMLFFFFRELFRLDAKQIRQSMLLSAELIGANLLILMGSSTAQATVISCVTSAYFVLIPPFAFLLFRQKPDKASFPGIAVVLLGLFLMMNADVTALFDRGVLFLLGADAFITLYFLTLSHSASNSNPSIIAMGQMFFSFLFTLVLWGAECLIQKTSMTLPREPAFWAAVIFISFFIRGLYGIVEIYALRYANALNAALIFSSEIVMTMVMSPVMAAVFGTRPEEISGLRIIGAVLMVAGILLADGTFFSLIRRLRSPLAGGNDLKKRTNRTAGPGKDRVLPGRPDPGNTSKEKKRHALRRGLLHFGASALVYFLFDWGVQFTQALGFAPAVGLKNLLPFILGLFDGGASIFGCCAGCLLSGALVGSGLRWILAEWLGILAIGFGCRLLWPLLSGQARPQLKTFRHYGLYVGMAAVLSLISGLAAFLVADRGAFLGVAAGCFFLGVFAGIPVIILLSSLLWWEPDSRRGLAAPADIAFVLDSSMQSLAEGNEQIEEYCLAHKVKMAKTMELENCLEELYIRVLKSLPETRIQADIRISDTISMRLSYAGDSYNPFRAGEGEDELDIAGLKLLRHRALRAAYGYSRREARNHIHVVV